MHVALYRKYRPKIFSEVVGQKYVVEALKNQIASGKIGHAFIFTGVRGTGKTSCAKIFAKAVNCLHPVNGEPCLECDICKGIENESIFDVTEMDAASNNSVEDIRDVLNEVNYLPVMAKYRVYIIDEVHMLSPAAFNALLKTLEEPPAHVIFILATTEIHKVPATILSRCQRYDFTKLTVEQISNSLLGIAQKENIFLTDEASKMIAYLADGAMRDADSILDTCISMGNTVDEDVVSNIVGISKDDDLQRFAQNLIAGDFAGSLLNLHTLYEKSADMRRLCEEMISYFSNMLLAGLPASTAGLLNMPEKKFSRLKELSVNCPRDLMPFVIKSFSTALDDILKGRDAKISMDLAVFNICNPTQSVPVQSPHRADRGKSVYHKTEQVSRPETNPGAEPKSVERVAPKTETEHVQRAEKPAEESQLPVFTDKPIEFSYWKEVVESFKQTDIPLYTFIKNSEAYLYNGIVYIKGNESLNEYIRNNREVNGIIKTAIANACGIRYNIGGYKNIEKQFAPKKHDSYDDILALRELGVEINELDK